MDNNTPVEFLTVGEKIKKRRVGGETNV